jgi:hypothetical protein
MCRGKDGKPARQDARLRIESDIAAASPPQLRRAYASGNLALF